MKITTFLILIALLCCQMKANAAYLFKNGHSDYDIVLSSLASPTEKKAAQELQQYIAEISGVTLPMSQKSSAKYHIFIGNDRFPSTTTYANEDEGYTYATIGDNLLIYGGKDRGTMYGVYAFLEQVLGVRWYTSSFTYIKKRKSFKLPALSHSERPAFRYREDFYYDAIRHNEWLAHNGLNSQYKAATTPYGKVLSYWGIHTFSRLMPPDQYFGTHPEYYSLNKGARSKDAQLCLSNDAMRQELTRNLKKEIEANPDYWCFDVSQNDNSRPCECEACNRLKATYGGESGIMLWFVNQVAREIKKTHPEVFIGTFAYRYTRKAPTSAIRPDDNVVVRLCDIECCMAHPLDKCPANKSFIEDFRAWQKIARNIFIWDYTTGFSNYQLPFPNLNALAENYRSLSKSNVIGILEEGSHNAQWSEFSEMKQWIVAKLLWNPYLDVDSLASMFIRDYYGKAAPQIQKYYNLCKKQISPDCHFTIDIDWNNSLYSDAFIAKATKLLGKATSKAKGDPVLSQRINRIATQIHYLKVRRNKGNERFRSLDELKKITDTDPTIFRELQPSKEEFFKKMEETRYTSALACLAVTMLAIDVAYKGRSHS